MSMPAGLLGAALVFWGWETGLFWIGLAAALSVEASRVLKVRWDFPQSDLDRVWNLCVALFLGGTIYAFFSNDNLAAVSGLLDDNSVSNRLATINQSKRSLFLLLQWLPVMFLPMALAQAYGVQNQFDLSTFSWWLRRKRSEPGYAARYPGGMNVSYPFFACCLFAASAGNLKTPWFAVGLVCLTAYALWLHRSRNFVAVSWFACLALALALGLTVQFGMMETQKLLQRLDEVLLARWSGSRNFNAQENETRIGSIGRMKLSGRIVLRVDAHGQPPPPLLREASYDEFHSHFWRSSRLEFERVNPDADQANWILHPAVQARQTVTISGYLPGGNGLLPVPNGVASVQHLPAISIATNLFGSVRVEDGPGFVLFDSIYGSGAAIDSPPTPEDGQVPLLEKAAIGEVARTLALDQLGPKDAVLAVEQFFARHFTYSVWQGPQHRRTRDRTALARFLLEHRSGHCEYFGVATTLLLRAAGIPARYATGYSVQEKSGRQYVVRERHAHAWCLAWIDGAWRDIDNTPGDWAAAEAQRASFLEPIRDALSRLWFEFSKWRWGHGEWKGYTVWLITPLLVIALGKILLRNQWTRVKNGRLGSNSAQLWPGLDSEFYAVERRLAQAGFPRQPGETGSAWIARVSTNGAPAKGLEPLLALHNRLRFDPRGLTADERSLLRRSARDWLKHASGSDRRPMTPAPRG